MQADNVLFFFLYCYNPDRGSKYADVSKRLLRPVAKLTLPLANKLTRNSIRASCLITYSNEFYVRAVEIKIVHLILCYNCSRSETTINFIIEDFSRLI